jgi:hypothetical protein
MCSFCPATIPHPHLLFQQLGVVKADGYDPPTHDLRNTLAATQRWLREHQETYSVKPFVPRSK